MKKILFLLFICFTGLVSYGQDKDSVRSFVQQKATPKEGLAEFMKNFADGFQLPELANTTDKVTVKLKFTVEKDGTFSDIEVLNDEFGIGDEAVRVLKTMPAWNPARHEGKNVRSKFVLPIVLKTAGNQMPEKPLWSSKEELKVYMDSLETYKMETDYFEFSCNCGLFKSSANAQNKTEEFFYEAADKNAYYNVVMQKIDAEDKADHIEMIKKEVEAQNGIIRSLFFNNENGIEVSMAMQDNGFTNHYRTLFFKKNDYFIAVNVVSYNMQLADLLIEHLKKTFKMNI